MQDCVDPLNLALSRFSSVFHGFVENKHNVGRLSGRVLIAKIQNWVAGNALSFLLAQ